MTHKTGDDINNNNIYYKKALLQSSLFTLQKVINLMQQSVCHVGSYLKYTRNLIVIRLHPLQLNTMTTFFRTFRKEW